MTFAGNMPGIDILAPDAQHDRKVTIQVKTRTTGDWQTSINRGRRWESDPLDGRYWALVDLSHEQPAYFLMPAYWIEDNIASVHDAYVTQHGGVRPNQPTSKHHRITTGRVEQWRDCWGVLGIFSAPGT